MKITSLKPYSDDRGNVVEVEDGMECRTAFEFNGSNNRMRIAKGAKLTSLTGTFDGNNGVLEIGANPGVGPANWNIRVGENSAVIIGDRVTTTGVCVVSAVEGTTVRIGDGCMIAANCDIRADDGHAIYDVRTGDRINVSSSVELGKHVWLAYGSTVLSGVTIGEGTVIGAKSVVTKDIPNNVIAAGSPAKVLRRDIAWERPHLSRHEPAFRPNASVIEKSGVWGLTREDVVVEKIPVRGPASGFLPRLGALFKR